MKLLTHNMLTSHVQGVTKGYPLIIKATEVKVNELEFNAQFVSRMIPKLEWKALIQAAEWLGQSQDLPSTPKPNYESVEDFLRKVHRILLEVRRIRRTTFSKKLISQLPESSAGPFSHFRCSGGIERLCWWRL
ncbi:multifunctional methyltransferase subunit TRM112-like protein isoform X1 [Carassius auratus]|uniref:Multifunctional methyltransferase subunit TRM112-like protein isoform X1 n=1 Tax=Carassius auratus TaxID=7957 RepID=A0A6P6JP77_CARAU|nr:multifunctional methyltransferase subunit TRM112-like protein isoform X1 [Carassius auratus]